MKELMNLIFAMLMLLVSVLMYEYFNPKEENIDLTCESKGLHLKNATYDTKKRQIISTCETFIENLGKSK